MSAEAMVDLSLEELRREWLKAGATSPLAQMLAQLSYENRLLRVRVARLEKSDEAEAFELEVERVRRARVNDGMVRVDGVDHLRDCMRAILLEPDSTVECTCGSEKVLKSSTYGKPPKSGTIVWAPDYYEDYEE